MVYYILSGTPGSPQKCFQTDLRIFRRKSPFIDLWKHTKPNLLDHQKIGLLVKFWPIWKKSLSKSDMFGLFWTVLIWPKAFLDTPRGLLQYVVYHFSGRENCRLAHSGGVCQVYVINPNTNVNENGWNLELTRATGLACLLLAFPSILIPCCLDKIVFLQHFNI